MATPDQTHRRLPPIIVPPLPIPTGKLLFSTQDIINLEKDSCPAPEKLIRSLARKWKKFFSLAMEKHKNIREFAAPFTNLPFKNRYDVIWQPPQISVDIIQKKFQLHTRPSSRQDQLCFDPTYDPGFHVSLSENKLVVLFTRFFEIINQARWCTSCGEFSWNYAYNSDLEICDHCLFEEICAFSNAETHHCTICLEDGKRMYKTRCGHYFHRKCLVKIESADFGPKCPLCRVYLDVHDERMNNIAGEPSSPEPSET